MQKVRLVYLIMILKFATPSPAAMDLFSYKKGTEFSKNKTEYFSKQDKITANTKDLTKSEHKNNLSSDSFGEETIEDLKKKILSADHLLKKQINIQKKIELKTFKTITYVQIARKIRIQEKGKKLSAEELRYLNLAKQEALGILNAENQTQEKRKYLYYLLGLIYMDLEDKTKSTQSFELSINNPKNEPYVTVISMYLGDLYFEEGRLDDAYEKYHQFYNQLKSKDKDYVQYKTAWIYIKKNEFKKALAKFFEIIKKGEKEVYYKDSISSVAFLFPDEFNQDQILGIVQDSEITASQKIEILYYTYFNLVKLPTKQRDKLFNYIINQEVSTEKKIKIYIQECILMLEKKEPSENIENLYFYLVKSLSAYKPMTAQPNNLELTNELKLVQDIGEILIEGRLAKINKKSNDLKKDTDVLNKIIQNQLSIEDRVQKIEELNLLSFALLYENQNYEKINEQYLKYINKSNANPKVKYSKIFLNKVNDYYFNSIIKLYEKSPQTWHVQYFKLLEEKSKNTEIPEKERQKYKNKMLEILVQKQDWKAAYDLVKESSLILLSPEEHEKVSFLAFKNNDCDKITNIKKLSAPNQKINQYLKECRLNLAQAFKTGKSDPSISKDKSAAANFANYEKNIISFILESEEDDKKYIAVNDYFIQLKQQNKEEKIEKILLGNKINSSHPLMLAWLYDTAIKFSTQGNWTKSKEYTGKIIQSKSALSLYQNEKTDNSQNKTIISDIVRLDLINLFAIEKKYLSLHFLQNQGYNTIWLQQLNYLSKYFEQQLILLNPKFVLDFFQNNQSKNTDKNTDKYVDKNDLYLASELAQTDWGLRANLNLYNYLKDILPLENRLISDYSSYVYLTALNSEIKEADIQAKAWDDVSVAKRIEKTQNSRTLVKKDLSQISANNALQILSLAKKAEQLTAKMVLSSKIPDSLSAQQKSDYKNELSKIADEFILASKEYEALENKFNSSKIKDSNLTDKKNSKVAKIKNNRSNNQPSQSSFPKSLVISWPKGYKNEEFIKKMISENKWWDIFLVSDLLFQKKWIDKNIYCELRHSTLLSANTSPTMQKYIKKEKEALKCN